MFIINNDLNKNTNKCIVDKWQGKYINKGRRYKRQEVEMIIINNDLKKNTNNL